MSHTEVRFEAPAENTAAMIIALLSEEGYEGFEEGDNELKAFIDKDLFDAQLIKDISERFDIRYSTEEIGDTNWNSLWESNFQPVLIDDFCAVRASFHQPSGNVKHEIVITPKMSFGTGHHATTYMMMLQMKEIAFEGKNVLDFGTGTGVLAILARKLGGRNIVAIDNDEWSITNARENFERNEAGDIKLLFADNAGHQPGFDIILANITRNVILDNFSLFAKQLNSGGILVLSGLLAEDEKYIEEKRLEYGLVPEKKLARDSWISLRYRKEA